MEVEYKTITLPESVLYIYISTFKNESETAVEYLWCLFWGLKIKSVRQVEKQHYLAKQGVNLNQSSWFMC